VESKNARDGRFILRFTSKKIKGTIVGIGARVVMNYLGADRGDIECTTDSSDQELLEAFAQGSGAALYRLVARYRTFLLCHCRRIVGGNMHDAKDLDSLVILKICSERPEQIRQIRNFGGWLCRVARNLYIDQRRTYQAEERRNDNLKHIYEIASVQQNSPEENFLNGELLKQIGLAFEILPPRLRMAAELRFVEDASYDFIAARLGISLVNARKRVQEARQRMTCSLVKYVAHV
jgi:RNA polymerase sigma factor (sigma-70 family)